MSEQLSEAEEKLQQLDSNQRSLSSNWLTEREDLKASVERLKTRAAELERTNTEKQRRIKELVWSSDGEVPRVYCRLCFAMAEHWRIAYEL